MICRLDLLAQRVFNRPTHRFGHHMFLQRTYAYTCQVTIGTTHVQLTYTPLQSSYVSSSNIRMHLSGNYRNDACASTNKHMFLPQFAIPIIHMFLFHNSHTKNLSFKFRFQLQGSKRVQLLYLLYIAPFSINFNLHFVNYNYLPTCRNTINNNLILNLYIYLLI